MLGGTSSVRGGMSLRPSPNLEHEQGVPRQYAPELKAAGLAV